LPKKHLVDQYRSDNAEAYGKFLVGRLFGLRGNLDDYRRASAMMREAIALDPTYAPAFAALSINESNAAGYTDDDPGYRRALAAADKAVALAPQLADGYRARAGVRTSLLDFWGAKTDAEMAIALAPDDSRTQNVYGSCLASFGRLREAIDVMDRAIQLDPLSYAAWENLGGYLTASVDYAGARRAVERALSLAPDNDYSPSDLVKLDLLEGQYKNALDDIQKNGKEKLFPEIQAMVEHSLGHERRSQQILDNLIQTHAADSAYQVAEVYGWRAEKDKGFEWLERAYQQRDSGLAQITYDPLLTKLRDDPRYPALLKQLGLPESGAIGPLRQWRSRNGLSEAASRGAR
jgi:Tfp pilus assembly protein PilF